MRAAIIWAAPAQRDFLGVLSYLKDHSPQAADSFNEAVIRQVKRLERFPESGRRVPEAPETQPVLRELLIRDYRLVYALQNRRVEIVAIFHARRLFKAALLH